MIVKFFLVLVSFILGVAFSFLISIYSKESLVVVEVPVITQSSPSSIGLIPKGTILKLVREGPEISTYSVLVNIKERDGLLIDPNVLHEPLYGYYE